MKFNVSPTVSKKSSLNDGFASVVKNSYDYFAEQGLNMMSDIQDILTEDTLFDAYNSHLCESMDVEDAAQLNQLLENARINMLQESSISGVSPLAGLTMPTIRKLWLKLAMKNAIPTEAAKIPTFTISYFKPYITEEDGTKRYLPESLRDKNTRGKVASKKALYEGWLACPTLDDGKVSAVDVDITLGTVSDGTAGVEGVEATPDTATVTEAADATYVNVNILEASCALGHGETIDPVFAITSVIMDGEVVPVTIKLSHEGRLYGVVTSMDGTKKDTLLGSVNLITGEIEVTSMKGTIEAMKITGYISSESNNHSQSVGFEIDRKNITIGTGAHINASLPIEFLQDSMALYNVDATLEVVDIMSNVVAQKLEYEIVDFFENSFKASGSEEFVGWFDVKPANGYAGSPLMWREEIKRVIDYKATQLKDASAFTNGYFVIFGHPLDMQIIPNVQWTFNHTADEKGGVAVDYDIGAYSGSHRYNLVSTLHCAQGTIHMFFVPESDKYMTYKYYPYAFNIEKGYLNPQMPNVPSIMMTKRHTIEEFTPVAAQIKILHNDGSLIDDYSLKN